MSARMSAPVRYGLKAMYGYLNQSVNETLNTHLSALVRARFTNEKKMNVLWAFAPLWQQEMPLFNF